MFVYFIPFVDTAFLRPCSLQYNEITNFLYAVADFIDMAINAISFLVDHWLNIMSQRLGSRIRPVSSNLMIVNFVNKIIGYFLIHQFKHLFWVSHIVTRRPFFWDFEYP